MVKLILAILVFMLAGCCYLPLQTCQEVSWFFITDGDTWAWQGYGEVTKCVKCCSGEVIYKNWNENDCSFRNRRTGKIRKEFKR